MVGFGVLLLLLLEEEGVADPEEVGVRDFDTGVEGLSFCRRKEIKSVSYHSSIKAIQ